MKCNIPKGYQTDPSRQLFYIDISQHRRPVHYRGFGDFRHLQQGLQVTITVGMLWNIPFDLLDLSALPAKIRVIIEPIQE